MHRQSADIAPRQFDASPMPGLALRAVLSALFAAHLTAVFVAPLASSIDTAERRLPPEAQPSERPRPWLHKIFQPYLDIAYLNHGYGFFAPDPGPSHLVRYTIEHQDGRREEGVFPDRHAHWPRLRYHRHFMLAEQALPKAGEAYGRHLLKVHQARQVTVERVRHYLARAEEVLRGVPLVEPQTYQSLGEVTVHSDSGRAAREAAP